MMVANQRKTENEYFSLLWPEGKMKEGTKAELTKDAIRDLDLEKTISYLTPDRFIRKDIMTIMSNLTHDVQAITYRLDIIEDLLKHPNIIELLEQVVPLLYALNTQRRNTRQQRDGLYAVNDRIGELDLYCSCIDFLSKVINEIDRDLTSRGIMKLKELVHSISESSDFKQLKEELPALMKQVRGVRSVTIGVNLNRQLQPVEATLLSINNETFAGKSLLGSLFSKKDKKYRGVGKLHSAYEDKSAQGEYAALLGDFNEDINPLMVPLFKDVNDTLVKISKPLEAAIKKYINVNSGILVNLRQDFIFLLSAVRLVKLMEDRGMPMCRPLIRPKEDRVFVTQNNYNINLALQMAHRYDDMNIPETVVGNNVTFDETGRVFVVTGPNRGGKTTFMQAVGLTQIFAQAGMPVPAESAAISPVDALFTHYHIEERPDDNTGRFGDEAKRLNDIFRNLGAYSMVLMNETFAGTSSGEGMYVAQDVLKLFRKAGTRAVFATHMHELAAGVAPLNKEVEGPSAIISVISRVIESDDGVRRTYKFFPGKPDGRSYAREIALKYGIGYDQLTGLLQKRELF